MSKFSKQMITFGVLVILLGGLAWAYFGLADASVEAPHAATPMSDGHNEPLSHEVNGYEVIRATFAKGDCYGFALAASEDENGHIIWNYTNMPDLALDQNKASAMVRDAFSLNNAEMILEYVENPSDFGISQMTASGYFSDGSTKAIHLGMKTPDRSRLYIMIDGDPALYLISAASGNRLLWGLTDLIERGLPFINTMQLARLYVRERGRLPIEFVGEVHDQLGASELTMITPYPGRSLLFQAFEAVALEAFEGFNPGDVVELFPGDLSKFGLDDPLLEFIMEDASGAGFHLLFGNSHNDEYIYMMYEGRPHVFLAEARFIENLLGLNPFRFIDRFVALVPILDVERITIESAARGDYEIVINNYEGNQIAPVVNGEEIPSDVFRRFYQTLIGISYDHDIGEQESISTPNIVITYYMLDGPPIVVEFFVYDANFYAVRQGQNPLQFVTSRLAVDAFFDALQF